MEKLTKKTLKQRIKKKKTRTNKFFIKAAEIANITQTQPNRWIRECKNNEWACERALIHLKEAKEVKSPIAYFLWLLKKYKNKELK